MIERLLIDATQVLKGEWWLVVLVFLFLVGSNGWLLRIRSKFVGKFEWILLEIKIPRENLKSLKSMEQVFTSLHATYTFGLKWIDKWWHGKVEEWMVVEMVGHAQSIHFYVYTQAKYRNLVEAAFFSQYPNAEIEITEDYTTKFGDDLPNDTYDLFGTDFILARGNHFPIKTHPFFEESIEERRLDPIATIAEVMSGLKADEMIWLQLLIRPTGDAWKKDAEGEINKITERKGKPSPPSFGGTLIDFFKNLIWAPVEYPKWDSKGKEEKPGGPAKILTPGEKDILKGIEEKMSKLSFDTILRFIYIDKRNAFTSSNVAAIMGAIRQFSTLNLNSFRPNVGTLTVPRAVGLFFRKRKLLKRKKKLFRSYLKREIPVEPRVPFTLRFKTSILSTEELATVYHPPITTTVGAPTLSRLETKKGSPPPNLPIE